MARSCWQQYACMVTCYPVVMVAVIAVVTIVTTMGFPAMIASAIIMSIDGFARLGTHNARFADKLITKDKYKYQTHIRKQFKNVKNEKSNLFNGAAGLHDLARPGISTGLCCGKSGHTRLLSATGKGCGSYAATATTQHSSCKTGTGSCSPSKTSGCSTTTGLCSSQAATSGYHIPLVPASPGKLPAWDS